MPRAIKVFHILTTAVVLFASAAAGTVAAQLPSAASTSEPDSGADKITLDLAVRDRRNKPVLDLRPEELSITDNGAPTKLSDLRLVNGNGKDEPLITLFFERPGMQDGRKGSDDYLFGRSAPAARETSKQLRDAAAKFLKSLPGSGIQLAVVDAWGRLQIQQSFTEDRKAITRAISAAVQPEAYGKTVVANAEEKRQIQIARTGQDASGSAGGTRERAIARSTYAALQASNHIARDQHLPLSLACLLALVEAQQSVPGRKAIVYFATNGDIGSDSSKWMSQDSHARSAIRSIIGAANRSGTNIYVVLPDEMQDTDQLAAIYSPVNLGTSFTGGTVDITGGANPMMGNASTLALAAMAPQRPNAIASQDNLNMLARQTGGDVINSGGRMSAAIKDLIQGLTTYYETSFVPSSSKDDGSFHATAFKTTRRGLRMRAQTGYLAMPPSAGITEPPQPFELPLMALLKRHQLPTDIDYRAAVLRMGRQDDGNVGLLALEVPVSGLAVQEDASTHLKSAHISVLATISDSSGTIIERFSEDIARRWATGNDKETPHDFISFERSFAAPPGTYVLETAIADVNNGKAAANRQTFEVQTAGSGPELSDLLLVRGIEPTQTAGGEQDLLWHGDQRVLPNLYGQLPVGERHLSVFLFAHAEPDVQDPATIKLEVLRNGAALKGGPPVSTLKEGSGLAPVMNSFSISSAADGRYEVRVTLTQGGKSAESAATFDLHEDQQNESSGTTTAAPDVNPPGLASEESAASDLPPEELNRILEDVRRNALDYKDTLPNLICQQTTTRMIDSHGNGNWQLKDKMVEVLTYVNHQESRTVVGGEVEHRKKDRKTMSQIGMISTGEFGVALSNIFSPSSKAEFTPQGTIILRGEPVETFTYGIAQENSSFALRARNASARVAYHGRVYVDRATHGVRSITIIAGDVPKKFPIRSAAVRVDYDYIAIYDHDYLLPVSAQVVAGQGRNLLERNDLEFTNFRKFGSSARMLGVGEQAEEK